MSEKVAVIIHCYNQAEYVCQAIQSALDQTVKVDIFVVDDASPDHSKAIIEAFCMDKPHIKRFFNAVNLGLCASFNQTIARIDCDYYVDLAGDDILLPRFIENSLNAFRHSGPKVAAVASGYFTVNNHLEIIKQTLPGPDFNFENYLKGQQYVVQSIMYKKACFEHLGGYDDTLSYEDFDFLLRLTHQYDVLSISSTDFAYRFDTYSFKKIRARQARIYADLPKILSKAQSLVNPQQNKLLDGLIQRIGAKAFLYELFDASETIFKLCSAPLGLGYKIIKALNNIRLRNFGMVYFCWTIKYKVSFWLYKLRNGSRNLRDL